MLGLIKQQLEMQYDRLILWVPVLFGVGISVYFGLLNEPPVWGTVAGIAISLLLLITAFFLRRTFTVLLPLCALCIIVLGFGTAQWAAHAKKSSGPYLTEKIRITDIRGTVAGIDRLEDGYRLLLTKLEVEDLKPEETPQYVRLKVRGEGEMPLIGQRVEGLAGLNPLSSPLMPGGFDFQFHGYFQRLGAVGFTYGVPKPIQDVPPERAWPFISQTYWEGVRQAMIEKINAALPPRTASLASALMTGERKAIPEEDIEAIRTAGLAHLLAISGLHIGLVAGFLFFFARLGMAAVPALALNYPIKKYAAVVALVGAALYVLLAGATVPTQRAFLMSGIVLLAVMLDRDPFSPRLVAFAALVVLFVSPEGVLSPSFQMSFAAVASLIFFYEATRKWWEKRYAVPGFGNRVMLYMLGIAATTIVSSFATDLFGLYHFQRVATYSLVGNLVAMPIMAFIVMPLLVIAALAMAVGLEAYPLWLAGYGLEAVIYAAQFVEDLPYASLRYHAWPISALVCAVVAALLCMLGRGWLFKAVAVAPALAAIIIVTTYQLPDILVSSSGDLKSVKMEGKLALSTARREKFAAGMWLERYGLTAEDAVTWPEEGAMGGLHCGPMGCVYKAHGKTIAFPKTQLAHAEDCAAADMVISSEPVSACAAPYIDLFKLHDGGAHAVWLKDLRVLSVAQTRGTRPWVITNAR